MQEFNQSGMISKTKERRLLLLNDLLVCVTVVSKSGDDYRNSSERLTLKWAFPITDVEVDAMISVILFDLLLIFFRLESLGRRYEHVTDTQPATFIRLQYPFVRSHQWSG